MLERKLRGPVCLSRWLLLLGVMTAVCLVAAAPASAQLNAPDRHVHYFAELEPHLVWQWTGDERARNDGVGMGLRASIVLIDNGPVPTINNTLAISFGLDWAHFPSCYDYGNCSEDDFWVPVAAQWNFYLTDVISLFPEVGLGFRNAIIDYDGRCRGNGCTGSALEVQPVIWFGARFRLVDKIAIVLRLGRPSLTLGVSFFL
jgi:hypothetical protein